MTLLEVTDWERFSAVRTWKKNLTSKNFNKELTDNAWNSKRTYFLKFLKFTKMNPDELIELAKKDNESVRDLVDDYYRELTKTIQKSSASNACYSVLRGFFSNNGIITQFWSSPKIGVLQSYITDEQNPIFIKTDDGYQLDRDFIKRFLDVLGFRNKIIVLCMLSSSLDPSDILNLKIEDVKYQKEENIYIHDQRPKSGEVYKTFFSKECSKLLREYVELERKNALDEEILFIPESKQLSKQYQKITGKKFYVNGIRVAEFPYYKHMSVVNLDMTFRRASKKLNIHCKKGQAQPFRPKRFRHTFQQCCSRSGIPETIIDSFMGHHGSINKQYETGIKYELLDYYEQVEPMLTIYEDITRTSKIVELEKKLSRLEEKKESFTDFGEEILERIKKLEFENKELRSKFES